MRFENAVGFAPSVAVSAVRVSGSMVNWQVSLHGGENYNTLKACAADSKEKADRPNVSRRRASALALAALVATALPLTARRQIARARAKSDPEDSAIGNDELLNPSISDREWRDRLTDAQYYVLRKSGTERPFSSKLNSEKRKGTFICAGCRAPLFNSETKFNSGTGWPSFFDAIPNAVSLHRSPGDFFLSRVEVRCARCDGHLGHVFEDGPPPTGQRYCMNGVALQFHPDKA